MDCLEDFSMCPACNQQYDIALILPCSHTICGRCVAAGEATSLHRLDCHDTRQSACSVTCNRCRQPIELPCWSWSSAASCLPRHPTLISEYARGATGLPEGSAESYHVQEESELTQRSKKCSHAVSSSVLPVDGAVDLPEEEMEQSVYGLCFFLDPFSVPHSLRLSKSCLTVTYSDSRPSDPRSPNKIWKSAVTPESLAFLPRVSADAIIARGQYYWEVDVCNSSVYRVGVISSDGRSSWWLERNVSAFHAVYDGSYEPIGTVPPRIKTLGIFLSFEGGILSFHNAVTQEHLATLPTRFSPSGVLPALGLGQGRLRLRCGLPTPLYVFLGKESTYRVPCAPKAVFKLRDVLFHPVKGVIQKFEKLGSSQ